MQREKVRIYALARELNVESKDLLDLCRQAGIDAKNQLSSLDPDQRDAVVGMLKNGGQAGGVAVAAPPKAVAAPVARVPQLPVGKPQVLPTKAPRREAPAAAGEAEATPAPQVAPPAATPARPAGPRSPALTPPAAARISESTPPQAPPPAATPPGSPAPAMPPATPPAAAASLPPAAPEMTRVPDLAPKPPPVLGANRVPSLAGTGRPPSTRSQRPLIPRRPNHGIATPPPLRAQPPLQAKKPVVQQPIKQTPVAYLPPDVAKGARAMTAKELLNPPGKGGIGTPPTIDENVEEEEGGDRKGAGGKARGPAAPGGVAGRADRHKSRNERAKARKQPEAEVFVARGGSLVLEEGRPQRTRSRLDKLKMRQRGPTAPRKGKVPITLPITVRSLSEAVGTRTGELLFKLKDNVANVNINSVLDPDIALAVALELGCELDLKKQADAEDEMNAGLIKYDAPEHLVPRAPVVTIMGHVDHGKTSLLDKIRKSNVAATETGGITQVIRAWRVEHNGKWITFLDTPGHEAFTKMRARGANVTDIAVIVVAADDGVMPQTEEAINHAKAAGVAIIVAINKVDLPNANVKKAEQQLYSMNLLPDNMGGDVPFVYTSAATGKGIDDLLEAISLVADYTLELKANPDRPARGTVLESSLNEGEGVLATLLVQDGTLHRGDVILAGATHGRVRALYDDLGRPMDEAGPSVPCRIAGLDQVPNASDRFQIVADLGTAREIAEKRAARMQEASIVRRAPVSLESLSESKIVELKVILKADFRGSIEAITKELEKLYHEEVRVRVLYSAIGAITENDVNLALASPDDTLVVGFNVVPDDRAKALAEERGVQIRQYNIIYNLTDDIRSALEGKLKPREEVIHLGRAVVRETFKISRVGTIAGCLVTQGTIERSAKVRLIREGIVVYPPPDRTASLESLKRFKEDAKEVREGYECGIKIHGYDDVKVGDVIEAYRVEHIQRKLTS